MNKLTLRRSRYLPIVAAVVTRLLICSANAQVYAYFPEDPVGQSYYGEYMSYVYGKPNVSGITVLIPWAAYDEGDASSGPILWTEQLTSLNEDLVSTASPGQPINYIIEAASGNVGTSGDNTATPAYVFQAAYLPTCCSGTGVGPTDVCYCNNYYGTTTGGFPYTGPNCYNEGNFPTSLPLHIFDNSGVPAAWELPFVTAYTGWLQDFLTHIESNLTAVGGTLGYIRIGVGTGGGSYIACPAVEAGVYSYGSTSQTSVPAVLLCTPTPPYSCPVDTWQAYSESIYSAAAATVGSGIVLEASMYGGEPPLAARGGSK